MIVRKKSEPPNRSLCQLAALSLVALAAASPAASATDYSLGLEDVVPHAGVLDRHGDQPEPDAQQPISRDDPFTLLPRPLDPRPALPARLRSDLTALAVAPLDWRGADWRKLGLGVLAVGAVSLLDDEIDGMIGGHRSQTTTEIAETVRPLGQEGGLALLGAAWIAGRSLDRPALTHAAEDGIEASILAAGVITPALKRLVGRSRPRNAGTSSSSWLTGESFPSGEATEAFAIAAVVAGHTEHRWIKGGAWGLAGVVGLSRMELDAHWASDVVAGVLIGSAVGHWVVRHNRPDRETGRRMTVTPTLGRQRYGLAMRIRL